MKVAKGLNLPADTVTQTFGFIGRKGSGKTYAAGKLAELLLSSGVQVVVLDPVGNWYGLRLDKSGQKPSRFNLPILGGEHGDVPLESTAGKVVADFLVTTGSPAVLDVSLFRKSQRKDFVAEFAEELFQRKKTARTPLHLVIEESQVFAPQQCRPGEQRMLGAIEDVVRLGRNYGIGVSLISQRPQSVNKEVLNQVEPLVVFQLVGAHERKAVSEWVRHVGADVDLGGLPALKTGECFVWSPGWLRIFERTRFGRKETFDASATPTLGQSRPEPAKLKPVDLHGLQASMAETIAAVRANDPKQLRKQIAELQKQLRQVPAAEADPEQIERAVRKAEADRDRHWQREIQKVQAALADREKRMRKAEGLAGKLLSEIHLNGDGGPVEITQPQSHAPMTETDRKARPRIPHERRPLPSDPRDERLRPAHQAILNALAWLAAVGIDQPDRSTVAAIAGVSPRSSGFRNNVSRLSSLGLVAYPTQGRLQLTAEGESAAETPDLQPSIEALHAAWRSSPALRPAHVGLLDVLIEDYPAPVSREDLAERAGVSVSSSGFRNNVSRLSAMGLAEYPQSGCVAATELLFPPELV